jgi:hypothetical protein
MFATAAGFTKKSSGRTLKSFRMKISTALLFERNVEDFAVEFATLGRLANNGTKTGEEENLYLVHNFHGCLPFRIISHLAADFSSGEVVLLEPLIGIAVHIVRLSFTADNGPELHRSS